jgi:hypothetical protein
MVEHRTLREGFIAGLIGATSVAVWFLIVDLIAGRPLFTPSVLGEALMNVLGPNRGEGPPSTSYCTRSFTTASLCCLESSP